MKSLLFSLIGLMGLILISGCAGTSNSAATNNSVNTCQGQVGMVYSNTYGCLPQAGCPAGSGLYQNQCVNVTLGANGQCQAGTVWNGASCVYSGQTQYPQTQYPQQYPQQGYNQCGGTCPAGSTQTQYGCLPQYRCQTCFGYIQGYCMNSSGQYYWGGY
jgi:hypothetical protein